jgi:hypothetical protein
VSVTERRVFYNGSAFDGGDPILVLNAIAPDKQALLPGETASFKNVTSYDKGINGIELMFFSPTITHPTLTADDLDLRVGTGGDPNDWVAGPAPSAVTVVPVPGPNSVYTVTWPDGAIRNTWLRVTIKANANTNLAAPDVFYFGNLVGETGDASTPWRVSAADLGAVKAHLNSDAAIGSAYDFNRDGVVNALDLGAVRANYGRSLAPPVVSPPVMPTVAATEPTDEPGVTEQILGT